MDRDVERFTPREREVAELLSAGKSNKEMAHALGIAPSRTKAIVSGMLKKLDARSRTELAVAWVEWKNSHTEPAETRNDLPPDGTGRKNL
ncbi:MAG: LuxR C-terminal-related transcriptional regulator [Bacteroidota bacterium]